jgi:hypothetical protein
MQIHEITQRKLDEGVGSFLGGLAGGIANVAGDFKGAISPGGDAKSAYASAVRPQQIKMLADKAYTGWKQYEKTLLQSNPDARTGDMYYQALLAFVTKNLLGGQYLPNVINKNQIIALVKQLSQSEETAKTPPAKDTTPPATNPAKAAPGVMPASVASSAQGQKMQQAYGQPRGGIEGMKSDLEEVTMGLPLGNVQQYKDTSNRVKSAPNPTPTAGTSLSPGQIPGKADLLKGKGKQATQPVKTPAPTPKTAPSTAMSAQQEKDLWLKLTQQAVVATTQAPGSRTGSDKAADPGTEPGTETGDARSYMQQLGANLKSEELTTLKKFASEAVSKFGSQQVKTTQNPVADAMLLLAGFRGI